MTRTQLSLVAAVGLLAVGIVAWLLAPDAAPSSAAHGSDITADTPPPPSGASPRDVAPDVPAPADKPATRVPRPAQLSPARRVVQRQPAPADDRAAAPQDPHDGPVDKRDHKSGDSQQLMEDIKAGMDQVRDDISDCIESWAEVSPDFEGRVVLRFGLDADGLQEVWIEEYQDVPAGPLTCFGAAVYEVDWADITDDPLEVSYPFEVSTGDTGA